MEIFDKDKNLIAIVHKDKDFKDGKAFYTDNEKDFQFGTFNLDKGEIIVPELISSPSPTEINIP